MFRSLPQIRPFAIVLFALLTTAAQAQDAQKTLTGVDGSVAVARWQPAGGTTSKTSVKVCATNDSAHKLTRGLSVGTGPHVPIQPGETHCRFVAPAKQKFVLWTYSAPGHAVRSISTRLNLTGRVDHVLWFRWVE